MNVSDDDAAESALFSLAYPDLTARLEEFRSRAVADSAYFQPPLNATYLTAWEKRHECRLPLEYRGFLMLVGNGAREESHYRYQLLCLPDTPTGVAVAVPFSPPHDWKIMSVGNDGSSFYEIEGEKSDLSAQLRSNALNKAYALLSQGCLHIAGDTIEGGFGDVQYLEVSGQVPGRVWNLYVHTLDNGAWSVTLESHSFFCNWLDNLWRRGRLV